jgi:hypothetical protein
MDRVLIRKWLSPLILVLCLLGVAQSSFATTAIVPPDDDLIIGARVVVQGKVLSIESKIDPQDGRIYTYVRLKVQEVLKGDITERKIVIKELGGRVGDKISVVYGNPQFKVGEKVLTYLDTWADGSLRTYQMFLGKFSIQKDEKSGHEFAIRDSGDEHVTVLPSVDGHSAGAITNRMEIRAYSRMVRQRVSATARESRSFQQTYYRTVPMLASPPGYDAEAHAGEIQPEFVLFNSSRWWEPDTGQVVPYTINPHPADPGSGIPSLVVDPADIAAAANSWSSVSGCALRLQYSGNLDDCYAFSGNGGINVVSNNCDGRNSPSAGCAGILAWGGYGATFFSPIVINGTTFQYRITQGFVSCNPWAACNFGDHCSVQFIVTHEMGHALGLGHSEFQMATMYAIAFQIARCAVIWSDDENGIRFIYPGSGGGGPGPLSITTTSLTGATVGSSYSQTLAASGGTTPYSWSLVAGLGTLPPGLSLSTGGAITGTPTTAGTYNFTVKVNDSASGSAQKALSIAVAAAGTAFDSIFISQNVPATLTAGQTFLANIVWQNTGTQTWNGAAGLRLISQNPLNNITWGGNTVLLPNFIVAPGEQLNLTMQAIAPTTPGNYNFQWQVARDALTPFGQMSTNQVIQVTGGGGGGGGTNNAAFVTQTVPATMTAGQSVGVSVTMQNSGTTTWAPGTYFLGSLNPAGNTTWGFSQVALTSSVPPGAQFAFNFNVTAPAVAGNYNFQWGMSQSGVGAFGQASTNVAVTVTGGGGGGGGLNAQYMSQNVPASLNPGQSALVTVTMKNNGTVAWDTISYKLGSQNPANNTTWGMNRASMGKYVPIGGSTTISFTITAPSTSGIYNFQWQMWNSTAGYFGAMTPNVAIQVGSGGGGGGTNGAAFVSQNVPSSMTTGQTAAVSVTMSNSGTTTWSPGTYVLGSLNPQGNTIWGLSQVALTSSVAPGAQATFNFNVSAPAVAGTYNFQWGMLQNGVAFGSPSTNVAVSVTSGGGGGGTNGASFVSQNVPASIVASQTGNVSVTMMNSGSTTWAAGTYFLGSQNPAGNTTWGLSQVSLASSVAPGASTTFNFTVTAPSVAGTYNFQWQMMQGSTYFGAMSTNVSVSVTSGGGGSGPLGITTATLPQGARAVPYSQTIGVTGGTQPYTFSVPSGSLPPGLTLNSSTGVLSGTPSINGTFNFTVMVRDNANVTATKSYKMAIR